MSIFRNLMMAQGGWDGKPADWDDIRIGCPKDSIALYAAHPADFSAYNNLGFTAACEGGYNVFIDGVQYGSTYASGTQCNITWSTSGITTGDDITTPSALKAHKIWIEPATEGNEITAFHCARVAASGNEEQGVLWAHFNLTNSINLSTGFGSYGQYKQTLMEALTTKNNIINCTSAEALFFATSSLEYVPILDFQNAEISLYGLIWNSAVKTLKIKNAKPTSLQYFANLSGVEKLSFINCDFSKVTTFSGAFNNAQHIKALPDFNFSTPCVGGGEAFVNNCFALTNDVILDLSNCTALNKFIATSTSKFKGLRVSNQAPFNNATAPQIDVSYTGMDRNALVQLFNDLPYNVGYEVVGSPTINNGVVSNFSSSNRLQITKALQQTGNIEFNVKFHLEPSATLRPLFKAEAQYQQFGIRANGQLVCSLGLHNGAWRSIESQYIFADNTTYKTNLKIENQRYTLKVYDADGVLLTTETGDVIYQYNATSYFLIGAGADSTYFTGSIYLNETYIKDNNIYWFRGQPAMTKTLSCVGCTGTSDLTADDKDIALNKGWSLTLS